MRLVNTSDGAGCRHQLPSAVGWCGKNTMGYHIMKIIDIVVLSSSHWYCGILWLLSHCWWYIMVYCNHTMMVPILWSLMVYCYKLSLWDTIEHIYHLAGLLGYYPTKSPWRSQRHHAAAPQCHGGVSSPNGWLQWWKRMRNVGYNMVN